MCQVTLLAIFIRTVMMECLTSCPVSNNTFNDVTHSSSGAAAPAKKMWLAMSAFTFTFITNFNKFKDSRLTK